MGAKQKDNVDRIVRAFDPGSFTVVLFHYDGQVDSWHTLPWSDRAVHVSAAKQSKWWFAKRFLHPDVVEPYEYLFVWDEDIDVYTDGRVVHCLLTPRGHPALINRHCLQASLNRRATE